MELQSNSSMLALNGMVSKMANSTHSFVSSKGSPEYNRALVAAIQLWKTKQSLEQMTTGTTGPVTSGA